MVDTVRSPTYFASLKKNILTYSIAAILIVAIIQSIRILIGYNQGVFGTGVAGIFLNWAGVIATIALALGIFKQALQNSELLELNEDLANSSEKQTLISQESDWIPEFRQPMRANWLLSSKNRPWYPWFKVEIEGEGESEWDDEIVHLLQDTKHYEKIEEDRELIWHEKQAKNLDADVDRYIPFPDEVIEFIQGLDKGLYDGNLYFRFKTNTDEEYFFIFRIHILVHPEFQPHGFRIEQTPTVERIMPWFESERREQLKAELDPIIEESKSLERLKERYPDEFMRELESENDRMGEDSTEGEMLKE